MSVAAPLVFIGMETSGRFRRRFQALGLETYSCDLLPAEDDGLGHIVGDVFETLESLPRWPSLAIFHPDCTHVTGAAAWAFKDPDFSRFPGVGYHQKVKPGTLTGAARCAAREASREQFRRLLALPIARKVIENPVGGFSIIRKPSQIVQPYEFGDDASKKTCFWFSGKGGQDLPDMRLPVDPAKRFPGRMVEGRERWGNQTDSGQNRLSPGTDRWKERSRTFDGIADAGAAHWSKFLAWDL